MSVLLFFVNTRIFPIEHPYPNQLHASERKNVNRALKSNECIFHIHTLTGFPTSREKKNEEKIIWSNFSFETLTQTHIINSDVVSPNKNNVNNNNKANAIAE